MIVFPVVGGAGKRFFPNGVRLGLELVEERRFRTGVVALRYATHSCT
jgi:dihydrofolate reductase